MHKFREDNELTLYIIETIVLKSPDDRIISVIK